MAKLYTRPPEIEAATDAVLAQDLRHPAPAGALIRDRHDPEYLPSECLFVHLIREAKRRGNDAARDKLCLLPAGALRSQPQRRGHRDFRTFRLHTLPGSRPASEIWKPGGDAEDVSDRRLPAYA